MRGAIKFLDTIQSQYLFNKQVKTILSHHDLAFSDREHLLMQSSLAGAIHRNKLAITVKSPLNMKLT